MNRPMGRMEIETMTIMRMIEDGSFIPDPESYPKDLVTVTDIYGHRHRVRQKHLDDGRTLLSRFNQYGVHILSGHMRLHRDNIQQ